MTTARTVRQAEGLDPVRALQRVLDRSVKQDRTRRFHALFDKLARSDVMWKAWVDVATNQGAPGVDGVAIADIEAGGSEAVRAFLDGLSGALRTGSYRPKPLRRVRVWTIREFTFVYPGPSFEEAAPFLASVLASPPQRPKRRPPVR